MSKFDWNKMDKYKETVDEGCIIGFYHAAKLINFNMNNGIYNFTFECFEEDCPYLGIIAESEDWETFKQKVADYFLGEDE